MSRRQERELRRLLGELYAVQQQHRGRRMRETDGRAHEALCREAEGLQAALDAERRERDRQ